MMSCSITGKQDIKKASGNFAFEANVSKVVKVESDCKPVSQVAIIER